MVLCVRLCIVVYLSSVLFSVVLLYLVCWCVVVDVVLVCDVLL